MARELVRLLVVALLGLVSSVACGVGVDLGGSALGDAGKDTGTAACAALAAPGTTAPCGACNKGDKNCQPNGCFNGYLCDVREQDCKPPGTACDAGDTLDARRE